MRLEEKALSLWAEKADHFVERRRQDVRDQADEMSPFASENLYRFSRIIDYKKSLPGGKSILTSGFTGIVFKFVNRLFHTVKIWGKTILTE